MTQESLKMSSIGYMKILMLITTILCRSWKSASSQRLVGCPVSSLQILTFNETLLPRTEENIAPQVRFISGPLVGTSFINYGPNHTDVWCAPELETFPQPRVNLIFTEPVVIVGIISGGYTYQTTDALDGLREYVNTFTLQHTLTDGGDTTSDQFTLYSANLTGNGETEFVIDDETVDQLLTLKIPFSALRVRLQVIDRTRSPFFNITCWSMAFLGCAASEAIYEETASTAEDAVTTPIPNEDSAVTAPTPSLTIVVVTTTATVFITPFSTCTPGVTSATAASQADTDSQQVVSIAIPIALVTVLIVVIVVLVGIVVCVKTKGRSSLLTRERGHRLSLSSSTTASTGTHYVNSGTALRGVARIADSNDTDSTHPRSATLKEIENELYQLNGNRNDDLAIYEAIPGAVTHNTIQGDGNTVIDGTPSPVAIGVEPPPYSSLGMASLLPHSSGAEYSTVPESSLTRDSQVDLDYGKVDYTVPFIPAQQRDPPRPASRGRKPESIQLSRNESYGSLPGISSPSPHYATPTSTLRLSLIPETHATAAEVHTTASKAAATDMEEYEHMMPAPGTATLK